MTSGGSEGWPADSFLGLLPPREREALRSRGVPVRFADDDIIVLQGEAGDFLYVLTSGLAKVVVAAESGAETMLAMRSRGDLLGEFALLDEKPRTATARAIGPVSAVRVSRAALAAIFRDYPAVQPALTRYLLAKLRASTERHAADRVWDARERLAQVLCELAEICDPEPDAAFRVPITQGELGQLAGVAVSTAERELAELRRRGVIMTAYNAIIVRDLARLRAIRFTDGNGVNPLPEGMPERPLG